MIIISTGAETPQMGVSVKKHFVLKGQIPIFHKLLSIDLISIDNYVIKI